MRIGMVGLGNLGTALAQLIAVNGHTVVGWEYNPEVVAQINTAHVNAAFLPDVPLDPKLSATSDLTVVVRHSDLLFVALPSAFIRLTLAPLAAAVPRATIVVNLAKGIDRETGLTAGQTLASLLPHNPRVLLSGPSIANEFVRGQPTVVVVAGEELRHLIQVANVLDNAHFRVRFSTDQIGVELGGILKNAYVIGLGLLDGQGIDSVNFRSVYLTAALEEMTRIGVALGGQRESFAYLAGLGDLLATAQSEASHNRRLGRLLVRGQDLDAIKHTMGVLPEGYNTLQMILLLAEKLHIPAPLAHALWQVLTGQGSPERFATALFKGFV